MKVSVTAMKEAAASPPLGLAARASANERSVRDGDSGADIFSAKRVGLLVLAGQGRRLCGLSGGWNRHRGGGMAAAQGWGKIVFARR